jgi:CBS domain-containing protein
MTLLFNVTKVKELMTRHPVLINPGATLEQAAKKMETIDCGALPVGTENKLTGIITDRDIVIRALAHGKNPATEKVSGCMTDEVYACNENDSLEEAAETMHKYKVSRLVVKDKEGKVTGILSFGSLFRNEADPKEIAEVVKHCSGPVSV